MYNQIQEHLNKYNILPEEQFGFRTDSSTNKAIYKLINEILLALAAVLVLNTPDDGRLHPKHVE